LTQSFAHLFGPRKHFLAGAACMDRENARRTADLLSGGQQCCPRKFFSINDFRCWTAWTAEKQPIDIEQESSPKSGRMNSQQPCGYRFLLSMLSTFFFKYKYLILSK
jgi:hypothetical protein